MDYRSARFPMHTLTDFDFTEYTQDRARAECISEEDNEISEESSVFSNLSYSSNISSAYEASSKIRDPFLNRKTTQTNANFLDHGAGFRKGSTSQSEREHAPHPCDEDEVRLPFLNVFSEKFSELLNMHKEIMLELLNKEEERSLKALKIVEDIITVSKQNEELKFFNRKLRVRAYMK